MATGPLPRGTLTFLFTDIEGSTKLLNAVGTERYHDVLEVHTQVETLRQRGHQTRSRAAVTAVGARTIRVTTSATTTATGSASATVSRNGRCASAS